MSSGGSSSKRRQAEAESKAKKEKRAMEARLGAQRQELQSQQSELAMRTASSLRARRRGAASEMMLGTDEQQSTLG
jgi:hypothetical protein